MEAVAEALVAPAGAWGALQDSDGELAVLPHPGCPSQGDAALGGALEQCSGEPRRERNWAFPRLNKICFEDNAKAYLGSPPGPKGSRFHCSETQVQRLQLSWQSPSYFHQMQFFAFVHFPKADLPAVQTESFLTSMNSCQLPADWGQRWPTARRWGRFLHPRTILPAFVSVLGSHSPPGLQQPWLVWLVYD